MKRGHELLGFLLALLFVGMFVARPYYTNFKKKVSPGNYTCRDGGVYPDPGVKIPGGYNVVGTDVSEYQGDIHWDALKQFSWDGYAIHFVFVRATMGINRVDRKFFHNWKEAGRVRIPRGAYHYYDAGISPVAQARHFMKTLDKARGDWQLPPVVDVEEARGLSPKALSNEVRLFCNEIEAVMGIRPILYTGATFYHDYIHGELPDLPLWVAHYKARSPRISAKKSWLFWQFSEEARLNGICGSVDLNVFNGSKAHFEAYLEGIKTLKRDRRF